MEIGVGTLLLGLAGIGGLAYLAILAISFQAPPKRPRMMSMRDAPHVKPREGYVDGVVRRWSMMMGCLVLAAIIAIPLLTIFVPTGR